MIFYTSSLNEKTNLAIANKNLAAKYEWNLNVISFGNDNTAKLSLNGHHLPHTKSDSCTHVVERNSVLDVH